jgi:hypothetical protein
MTSGLKRDVRDEDRIIPPIRCVLRAGQRQYE